MTSDREIMARFMRRPGFLLARVDQICTAIFSALVGDATLSQAEFLLLLDRLGPMIQIELARTAGVDKSTTAYILDNLEARDLVRRDARSEDRRSVTVSLTEAGAALIPALRKGFAQLQHRLEEPLDPRDRTGLLARLYRLAADPEALAPLWRPACDPADGVLDHSLSFLSRRLLQQMQAQFQVTTQGYGITLRQFSLLFLVDRRGPITQTEFARVFGLDPATCAVIIRGPVRRGLLRGERCAEDGRARRYHLTEQGLQTLHEVQSLVDGSEDTVFRAESIESREELVRQLQLIVMEHSHLLRFPGAIFEPG